MAKVFLTGITGLVGRAFVCSLLKQRDDISIVCLVRKSPVKSAYDRVSDIILDQCGFDNCQDDFAKIMSKIEVIDDDVTKMLPEALAQDSILQNVDTVFHCAADVNLGKDPTGKTYNINFHGTENVLKLARLLKVKAFHYVSTAYVAGTLAGRAMEARPQDVPPNNPYEDSKRRAEGLIRDSGIPFTIYRPAIIVGRLQDGRVRKALAFYRIVEFLAKLKKHHCTRAGVDPASRYDLNAQFNVGTSEHIYFVPIDFVQYAITELFQKPVANETYHVTGDSPVTTIMIRDALCRVLNIEDMEIAEFDNADLNQDSKLLGHFIGDLFPYFKSDIIFDQTNIRSALGDGALDWRMGMEELHTMMRTYMLDFFPKVEWIQRMLK